MLIFKNHKKMKKLFAMAVSILPGKTPMFRKFINELNGKRNADFIKSRKKLNVHERTFFQSTPMCDMVVVTLEGHDPENAFKNNASSNDEFTNWFVKEVHGLDLKNPPKGPLPEVVIDTMDEVFQS